MAQGKESAGSVGDIEDPGSIPGSGRSLGGGNGNSLQYSYLENPTDSGAWWATVHRVTKSQRQLKRPHTYTKQINNKDPLYITDTTFNIL